LETLQELGVGNVMMFSLQEPTKPANTTQIALAAADEVKKGDEVRSIDSVTIRNPTEINVPVPSKKGPPPPPPPGAGFVPYKAPDQYEMHRISIDPRITVSKQTIFRFLGIPIETNQSETNNVILRDRILMSQEDIKTFLERNKAAVTKLSIIETLREVPVAISSVAYAYLNTKGNGQPRQSHTWTVECILPAPTKISKTSRFWSKKEKKATSFLVVFKGEFIVRPQPPRYPPFSVLQTQPIRPFASTSRNHPKPAANFELSQQETENVINDYLASFSTLYDDVPVDERGAALKAIILPTRGDSNYDSSSSGSCSSRSLVDD